MPQLLSGKDWLRQESTLRTMRSQGFVVRGTIRQAVVKGGGHAGCAGKSCTPDAAPEALHLGTVKLGATNLGANTGISDPDGGCRTSHDGSKYE